MQYECELKLMQAPSDSGAPLSNIEPCTSSCMQQSSNTNARVDEGDGGNHAQREWSRGPCMREESRSHMESPQRIAIARSSTTAPVSYRPSCTICIPPRPCILNPSSCKMGTGDMVDHGRFDDIPSIPTRAVTGLDERHSDDEDEWSPCLCWCEVRRILHSNSSNSCSTIPPTYHSATRQVSPSYYPHHH